MIRSCEEVESFINDSATLCMTSYVRTFDCGPDAECFEATCVLPKERCPTGAKSLCRDGYAHPCIGDRIWRNGYPCSDFEGASCVAVERDDGTTDGVCSLASAPCAAAAQFSDECRGNTAVHCMAGYPVIETACPNDKPCAAGYCAGTWG